MQEHDIAVQKFEVVDNPDDASTVPERLRNKMIMILLKLAHPEPSTIQEMKHIQNIFGHQINVEVIMGIICDMVENI